VRKLKTCIGKTREEWTKHLDFLFAIAHDGENIPLSALLFVWKAELADADLEWALEQLMQREDPKTPPSNTVGETDAG
jgi:hypothetical protein